MYHKCINDLLVITNPLHFGLQILFTTAEMNSKSSSNMVFINLNGQHSKGALGHKGQSKIPEFA